jgi:hypothetical protein
MLLTEFEVRQTHFEGDPKGFFAWAEKNFGKSKTQLSTYISLAGHAKAKSSESLRDFNRKRGRPSEVNRPRGPLRDWAT